MVNMLQLFLAHTDDKECFIYLKMIYLHFENAKEREIIKILAKKY